MKEPIALGILLLIYTISTVEVLQYVHSTSDTIIDEVFHLPIGLRYCTYNFSVWDDKITTLPGLYLFSTVFTAPFHLCSIFALRSTVYLASLINIIVIFYLSKALTPEKHEQALSLRVLNTINIVSNPPVFFFSNVYYTDILSMLLVNSMILFGLKGRPFISSILGFVAMITRQNNIIYIIFIAGYRIVGHLLTIIIGRKTKQRPKQWDWLVIKQRALEFKKRGIFQHDYSQILLEGFCYLQAILAMALFIYLNGSVVVGDKDAHTTSIHIPQLFYFSLFVLFFSWMHAFQHIRPFCERISSNFIRSAVLVTLISLIVKYNTIIHPYLLADNRHYLFYVWKRFLRTDLMRLAMSPIYTFGLYCFVQFAHRNSDFRFVFTFAPTLAAILCTQNLIDVRYFLTPFVLLRLYMSANCCEKKVLVCEFMSNIVIIALTMYILGTKEIRWQDFDKVQRLIW